MNIFDRGCLIRLTICFLLFSLSPLYAEAQLTDSAMRASFASPPASARPWVYWFWMNGEETKEGITADLEAMQRVGIGGVLIMEVDVGTPPGPVAFAGPQWRSLFQFACSEAHRLGLQINMTNDAGWCGSGGPWITPELSMQTLVSTETSVTGGQHVDLPLAQPAANADYYQDVAVLAFPTPSDNSYRIADIQNKADYTYGPPGPEPAAIPNIAADQAVPRASIVDLTQHFNSGRLTWDAPPGAWTVLRFGHTSTGVMNHPAPVSGLGLESDKLSSAATDAQFAGLMNKLISDNPDLAGKTLVSTHIDSWETGTQNWTPTFRSDFQRLRGYDPLPYLPVMTGRVVGTLDQSERFLWDLRQTISDLLLTNYAGRMRQLANQKKLRLSIEAYGSVPVEDLEYAGQADEPMGEYWSVPLRNGATSVTEMVSAAHVYGKRIVGAESFTADIGENWLLYPGKIKALGDWALCEGINRFVVHRYTMQPWNTVKPGLSMGYTGLHYERTTTWWEQSKPWHQYLARCQYMLRQGRFAPDICYMVAEGAPRASGPPADVQSKYGSDRPGYNYDLCPPSMVMSMSVKRGRLVLPDGMSYRVLALPPDSQTMTPELLTKIARLVEAGAILVGPRPVRSPSLVNYPACDDVVQRLANRLWGADQQTSVDRRVGLGRVISGKTATEALAADGLRPDFDINNSGHVIYTHRVLDNGDDLYFVANQGLNPVDAVLSFRVTGRQPELWWPESGQIEQVAQYSEGDQVTTIPLHMQTAQSVFVLFSKRSSDISHIVSIESSSSAASSQTPLHIVITAATYGPPNDPARTRDVRSIVQSRVSKGELRIPVSLISGDDPAFGVVKTLAIDLTAGGKSYHLAGSDGDAIDLLDILSAPNTPARVKLQNGRQYLEAWQGGSYVVKNSLGTTIRCTVAGPPKPLPVEGPWQLTFPPNSGAPTEATYGKLISWSDDPTSGIKYFSGTATYRNSFAVPRSELAANHRLYLNLGDVEVMAQVLVNGKDLRVWWTKPFREDVTNFLRPGVNTLEVRVTNLWPNRMIGDEQLPDDSKRSNGMLTEWPQWVLDQKPSPTGRYTFTTWRLWNKDSPLQPSGLLGPVQLQCSVVQPIDALSR